MDIFIGKKIGYGPKNVKGMIFLGFSHITARKRIAFLLCCSDDAQTYRIVVRFSLEGAKQNLSHKTVVNFYLPLQKFQGSEGVDFRFVKFQLIFLFPFLIALL